MNLALENEPASGAPIYAISLRDSEFRQGEVLTGVIQHLYVHGEPGSESILPVEHQYCIIASQDCDLFQDHDDLSKNKTSSLNSVLIYEARPHAELLSFFPEAKERAIRKRIEQNKDERFHYLRAVPPHCDAEGKGLPDLIIDFRRLFAMLPNELRRQCSAADGAKRRCRLADLFREHLQSRIAYYLQRVALPEQQSQ